MDQEKSFYGILHVPTGEEKVREKMLYDEN